MHKLFFIGILLFLINNQIAARDGDFVKSKSVTKTYSVTSKSMIKLDNKFGDIKIISSLNNQVEINIDIEVSDNSEKQAKKMLDRITIEMEQSGSGVFVKTKIDGGSDNINTNSDKDKGIKIDYEISIPETNLLDITNKFGTVTIDNRKASTKINLEFGSANLAHLKGKKNNLNFKFADPVIINSVEDAQIDLKFSKLELGNANHLKLTSEMSTSKITQINNAELYIKFGSTDVEYVGKIILKSQMSSVNLGNIDESAEIDNKYGALKIKTIASKVKSITIDSEFSPVKLNLEKAGNYRIDATSTMGGLKLPSGSFEDAKGYEEKQIMIQTIKDFKGRIGSTSENASQIKIKSSFGDVKISFAE